MSDASDNARMRLRESLSALMDGEANELEMRRVLDRLGQDQDQDLREAALSYQRIGETIRNEENAFSGIDLSASISSALADEPAPVLDEQGDQSASSRGIARTGWAGNLGRFAIAASVAMATVVGVQTWNVATRSDESSGGTEVASVAYPSGNLPTADMFGARGLVAGLGSPQTSLTPEQMSKARGYADRVAQERFRAYMLEHAEQTSAQTGKGVMPFVRAASYQQ